MKKRKFMQKPIFKYEESLVLIFKGKVVDFVIENFVPVRFSMVFSYLQCIWLC